MFNNQVLAGSSGQGGVTQQSLKFNDDESQYLSWTPAAAGNRKTWTWSGWIKRGNLGTVQTLFARNDASVAAYIIWNSNNKLEFAAASAGIEAQLITTPVYRDASAFYHIVMAFDTTQTTASDRIKFYINGVQITSLDTASYPSQNYDGYVNTTQPHYLGSGAFSGTLSNYFDGYLSDVYFIDGQALAPTSFGQFTNGYWEKKDYAGTYGTNGFHLTFEDDVVSEGFNAVTYTGTGATQSISGLGLSPDFVWIKSRSNADPHELIDTVRGSTKRLRSNATNAESTALSGDGFASFDADGFTLNSDGGGGQVNGAGRTYVGWCWDAGSGSAASNTDGSITSTVKANPSYGFSIVSYTGTGGSGTVGHGLSSAPEMVIVKPRDISQGWSVWHNGLSGGTYYLSLNTADAQSSASSVFTSSPSSTVINVGSDLSPASDLIAYCFNSVAGYSSFGSYTGNGSTSGPTVTTGFRPAFVMVKRTDSTANWAIFDATRSTSNPRSKWLLPNLSNAEGTDPDFEFTDTGFNLVGTGSAWNASGGSYIYMAFADTREAAFWKDVSGQGNHWTPNNLDYRDSVPDSPANNFATFNPLFPSPDGAMTLSEGNLKAYSSSGNRQTAPTIACTGKSYFEFIDTDTNGTIAFSEDAGVGGTMYYNLSNLGRINYNATTTLGGGISFTINSGSLFSWSITDIVGVAYDADNHTLILTKNGGSAVNITINGLSGNSLTPQFVNYASGSATAFLMNFGQDSTFSGAKPMGAFTDDNSIGNFQYAPPAGYLALCTSNLPEPTIVDGSEHFNTLLWSGNSIDNRDITGIGFDADFTWLKARSNGNSHGLADTVRGNSAPNMLASNQAVAEFDWTGIFKGHISDGFTVGTDSAINLSGETYVAWNWKAGGTAVSNTDGSITSSVSANTDAGFSIVSYTGNGTAGATVGHGLTTASPEMIILKKRTATGNWITYHKDANASAENGYVALNLTSAWATNLASWNNTAPSSSVFTVGSGQDVNLNSEDFIGYCFHSVDGFSKVGSYTGNGSSDGPFVYTGFRPAWVMCRRSSSAAGWHIFDRLRPNAFNVINKRLEADNADAENSTSGCELDFLSNGFKFRGNFDNINGSGATHIYLAFAENPFKYANAR